MRTVLTVKIGSRIVCDGGGNVYIRTERTYFFGKLGNAAVDQRGLEVHPIVPVFVCPELLCYSVNHIGAETRFGGKKLL